MVGLIRQERRNGVMILGLNAPPDNLLTLPMRQALDHALAEAIADPGIAAIVLTGTGNRAARGLSAGLDLLDPEAALAAPRVVDICRRIEESQTPVVAVLHGRTVGAGVELALSAHARLGTGEASLGFREFLMGLCPSAGATQLLPRFLDAQQALEVLLSQQPRLLRSRHMRPLVDRLVPEEADAVAAAVELAQGLAAEIAVGGTLGRSSDRREGMADFTVNAAAVAARRAQVAASPNIAGARIVDCVEAALLLPFESGIVFEATAFEDLLASDVSKSLRHVAQAERLAAVMPELAHTHGHRIDIVAIVGGGAQAAQLAAALLVSGVDVIHFERSAAALQTLEERVAAAQEMQVKAGRLLPEAAGAARNRWRGTTQLTELAVAGVLIEAVGDVMDTKMQVMAALDRVAASDAVLATTTGLLEIDRIAAATARPASVLGLRLSAPATLSRLAEVTPGAATSDVTVATAVGLLRDRLGRIVLRSGTGGGGLGEPVLSALHASAAGMLRMGVSVQRIDRVLQEYGFPHGVFRQIDLAGLETVLARRRVAAQQVPCGTLHLDDLDRLIMAGRTGHAAGRGFYIWQEGRAQPDLAVTAVLDLPDAEHGAEASQLSDKAIILRAVAAMANAGARALRAGLALRPSDIDVAMVLGNGFPRWHGGPMKAADLVGLFEIMQALNRFAVEDPALYTADPGFSALVREGRNFESLNETGMATPS